MNKDLCLPVSYVLKQNVVEEADTSGCESPIPGPSQFGSRKQLAPIRFQAGNSDESDWSNSESTGTSSDSNTEDNGF